MLFTDCQSPLARTQGMHTFAVKIALHFGGFMAWEPERLYIVFFTEKGERQIGVFVAVL